MREVVPCGACGLRTEVLPCGFEARPRWLCQLDDGDVDAEDGCTRGEPGEATVGATPYDVDLSATYAPATWEE